MQSKKSTPLLVAIGLIAGTIFSEIYAKYLIDSSGVTTRRSPTHPGRLVHSSEGYSISKIKNDGNRDFELATNPLSEKVTIIGDSYVEGLQLNNKETFCYLLSNKRKDLTFTAIGISGLGPADYLDLFSDISYKPIVNSEKTILILNLGDFIDDAPINRDLKVEYKHLKYRSATRDNYPQLEPFYHVSLLVALLRSLKPNEGVKAHAIPTPHKANHLAANIDFFLSKVSVNRKLQICYIPKMDYFNATESTVFQMNESQIMDDELKFQCKRYGVPYISFYHAFRKAFAETHQPLHGFSNTSLGVGHINKLGHATIAQSLANWIP
jgi:hypothetical protein